MKKECVLKKIHVKLVLPPWKAEFPVAYSHKLNLFSDKFHVLFPSCTSETILTRESTEKYLTHVPSSELLTDIQL